MGHHVNYRIMKTRGKFSILSLLPRIVQIINGIFTSMTKIELIPETLPPSFAGGMPSKLLFIHCISFKMFKCFSEILTKNFFNIISRKLWNSCISPVLMRSVIHIRFSKIFLRSRFRYFLFFSSISWILCYTIHRIFSSDDTSD